MGANEFPLEWLRRLSEIVYKIAEAIIFSRSIEIKIDEIGKMVNDGLKLPYIRFKLSYKEKFISFIKYIKGEYNSWYNQLLHEYINKIIINFIKINNLKYSEDVFILFIIASYRDNLKFSIGKNDIDITLKPYLEIINRIRSNPHEKALLASLYNIYISGITERNMLDLLKKAEEISDKINVDIFIDAIESVLKQSSLSPAFFLGSTSLLVVRVFP